MPIYDSTIVAIDNITVGNSRLQVIPTPTSTSERRRSPWPRSANELRKRKRKIECSEKGKQLRTILHYSIVILTTPAFQYRIQVVTEMGFDGTFNPTAFVFRYVDFSEKKRDG